MQPMILVPLPRLVFPTLFTPLFAGSKLASNEGFSKWNPPQSRESSPLPLKCRAFSVEGG
jgi:hypothetical protein